MLRNLSKTKQNYTIYLDDIDLLENEIRLEDEYLRYSLVKDGENSTKDLTSIGTHPTRILDKGVIKEGQSITYDLRLWMKISAGNDAMNKVFSSKLRIVTKESGPSENNEHILSIYQYDEKNKACVTGEEATCVPYKEAPSTYEVGTILKYEVKENDERYFFVVSDNGNTLTLQQRENTVKQVAWYELEERNTYGPITALEALENETKDWVNVLDQTYTLGETIFKDNPYTGCNINTFECAINLYTLPTRTAKARMITTQEAKSVGCSNTESICPIWTFNYLNSNLSYGGTMMDVDFGYWTMNANTAAKEYALRIRQDARIRVDKVTNKEQYGARAVVVITK